MWVVIEVGCLECSSHGSSDPQEIARTPERTKVCDLIDETRHDSSADRFGINLESGELVSVDTLYP